MSNIPRGHWQAGIFEEMVLGMCHNPVALLRGNAKSYLPRYQESFEHLVRRAMKAGWHFTMHLGPRGGAWSADFSATEGDGEPGSFTVFDTDGNKVRRVDVDSMPGSWDLLTTTSTYLGGQYDS